MIKLRLRQLWVLFLKDPAVRYSLFSKVAAFGFGPLTIIFIGTFLDPEEQGVYYVFGSLLQLRTFVDLGFSQSSQQLLAHAFGALSLDRLKGVIGDNEKTTEFLGISRLVFRIYYLLGLLTIILLGAAGHFYLKNSLTGLGINWCGPWWAMVISLGFGVGFQGILTFADSANCLAMTNKWRLIAELSGIVLFLVILRSGGDLWASAAFSWSRCILTIIPISVALGLTTLKQVLGARVSTMSYRKAILPLQLRNMVAYGMGFFIFYIYTPMSLSLSGALVAGTVGMSLQIGNMIQNFSTVWFNAKIPLMGNLAGSGETDQLISLHRKGMKISTAGWFAFSSMVIIGAVIGKQLLPEFGTRYGSISELSIFVFGTAGFTWSHLRAAYIRAHRIEPFARLATAQGIVTFILLCIFLPRYGAMGAAMCFATTMTVGAVCVEIVYRKYLTHFPEPTKFCPGP